MANFLGNLGAAFRGQQDYQQYLDAQEATKLRLKADKAKLSELEDLADEAKKQRARQPDIDQTTLDYLAGQGMGLPPPPAQGGMPDGAQAPAPGQASVPMIQPDQKPVQYNPNPQAPGGPPGMGMPPPPPQGPPPGPPQGQMPPQGPQMAPQGPPRPQQGPAQPQGPQRPPVPPYQTVGGAGPQQAQQPQGIPPPPQQPGQPAPNSMSLQDAAQFIKARGITDPQTSLQILEKLSPYLNNQAKQEAAMLKMQMGQQQKAAELQQKQAELTEKYYKAELDSKDKGLSIEQRNRAEKDSHEIKQALVGIAQQRETRQAQTLQQKIASNSLDKDDLRFMAEQFWAGDKTVLSGLGRSPQMLSQARHAITEYGKEHGKNGADVAQATAEFEGMKSAERALGTRAANVGIAVNEANLLSNLALKTSDEWKRTGAKSLNDLQKYATSKGASPELRKFVAANNSFINAYARAISPSGVPTVSDKEHAREMLDVAFSKGDYQATIGQLQQEMEAAKEAPQATKEELRKLAKAGNGGNESKTPAGPAVGTVQGGYRFKGGDPGKQANWEKI